MKQIDVATAKDAMGPDTVLLDVREQHEWDAGHAVGAVHIPGSALNPAVLDKSQTYLVVCRSGTRSATAAGAMAQAGYTAANVEGGMNAWASAGLPMESSTGQPAQVIAP